MPALRADVVVVAAGRSSRMGGEDKLSSPIDGRPLLAWTLAAVAAAPVVERIVVVVAAERVAAVRAAAWLPPSVVAVVAGGERRQGSVAAGVTALPELAAPGGAGERVVLVHDGARPLVTPELIEAVAVAAAATGAAIPVLPIAETVKRVDGDVVAATVDRATLATAQTPQGARLETWRTAWARFPADGPETWTDEAALLEACRIAVHVVPGDPRNLKVTRPGDLERVRAELTGHPRTNGMRVGIGQDSHPFGSRDGLALGGIVIAGAPALEGHSDGDVALHAVADALLGAAGLGDLGRLFPAGPETPAGVASRDLLGTVAERVSSQGWRIADVDLTIIGARPRLGAHLDAMRTAIAAAVATEPGRINVKASSGNLGGDEGAGRTISALAVAALEPVGDRS